MSSPEKKKPKKKHEISTEDIEGPVIVRCRNAKEKRTRGESGILRNNDNREIRPSHLRDDPSRPEIIN